MVLFERIKSNTMLPNYSKTYVATYLLQVLACDKFFAQQRVKQRKCEFINQLIL